MKIKKFAAMAALCGFLFNVSADARAAEAPLTGSTSSPSTSTLEERLKQIITVEYKDADLASVLRSLALTYKLNLLTGPDVKGKVTINLQDITVESALAAILKANGLIYNKKDGVIYVNAGDSSSVDVYTEVIQLKYLTATQAQNMTRKMLSTKGDMKINETTNNIVLTDYRDNIDKIRDLLRQTDTAPKQVLIEAKILDISSSAIESLGIEWNAQYAPGGGLFGRNALTAENVTGGVAMGSTASATGVTDQFKITSLILKGLPAATLTVDALVRDGKAHILASPSIAVISGQEARIVIGERYPYKERTQTTSGTTETTKFVDIGTTLKVKPQINDDGYITLSLHPEVSSFKEQLDAGPRVTTREADTTVRIKEGETLVIGGLIQRSDNDSYDKIPLLGDLPIVGALFKRKSKVGDETELAVFITPRILYSREERIALGRKQDEMDSYALVDKISRSNLVEKMYELARGLDLGEGIQSVRKDEVARKSQAISQYEVIIKQFPDSERVPEATYRAGMIYWKTFGDMKAAKNSFSVLITNFPDTSWARDARQAYDEVAGEMKTTREKENKENRAFDRRTARR